MFTHIVISANELQLGSQDHLELGQEGHSLKQLPAPVQGIPLENRGVHVEGATLLRVSPSHSGDDVA
jgi:hypothetical protein